MYISTFLWLHYLNRHTKSYWVLPGYFYIIPWLTDFNTPFLPGPCLVTNPVSKSLFPLKHIPWMSHPLRNHWEIMVYIDDKSLSRIFRSIWVIYELCWNICSDTGCMHVEKCEFHKMEVSFLGHHIGAKGISMEGSKVHVVSDWPAPVIPVVCQLLPQVYQKSQHDNCPLSSLLWGKPKHSFFHR